VGVARFRDRRDAGRHLAAALAHLRAEHPVVLGLPRGGVPVAAEVAAALGAPLDVILVRKLGVPYQPELAMGAIGEDGVRVLNRDLIARAGITDTEIARVEAAERAELERRARRFRGDRPAVPLEGRTVVIVDDGLATGATARAAVQVARAHGARRVVLAVPVAPPDTAAALAADADEVIAVVQPTPFYAIGQFYDDFTQTPDDEVIAALDAARARTATDPPDAGPGSRPGPPGTPSTPRPVVAAEPIDREVEVPTEDLRLPGHLAVPAGAVGVVAFAHGSGSSRHSPRNRSVAAHLQRAGLGTLLFDLLTPAEAADRRAVFDIPLLAARLDAATRWLAGTATGGLPVGAFGASTGAAAALWAAAEPASPIRAVVSRGGRPDLAAGRLARVRVPTLLIVGGADPVVLQLNEEAARLLGGPHRLEVVPGAGHLFEEPGALEVVADLAAAWFRHHLA
jgi:putative phosphoribosyl transferase